MQVHLYACIITSLMLFKSGHSFNGPLSSELGLHQVLSLLLPFTFIMVFVFSPTQGPFLMVIATHKGGSFLGAEMLYFPLLIYCSLSLLITLLPLYAYLSP